MEDVLWRHGAAGGVLLFSMEETWLQLHKMAKNTATDLRGRVIEMLQEGSDTLLQRELDVFSDKLKQVPRTPAVWAEFRVRVLYEKGTSDKLG